MNILLSSAGRRVGLLRCFRDALDRLGLRSGRIIATDASTDAPAAQFADGFHQVPRCGEEGFLEAVERVCRREEIGLIVPTIDPELEVFAGARLPAAISSRETVALASDKRKTSAWLRANGFPTPTQADPARAAAERWSLPLIVKPACGSASVGVRRVLSRTELVTLSAQPGDWVAETIASGQEYTVHAFVNSQGRCEAAVPCRRVEVRAGEVSKACTERVGVLIDAVSKLCAALPGAYGPLNIQCFLDPDGSYQIIEINARFGGGYPLADRAGAGFVRRLLEDALGRSPSSIGSWAEGLAMLRFDEALYLPASRIGWQDRAQGASRGG